MTNSLDTAQGWSEMAVGCEVEVVFCTAPKNTALCVLQGKGKN